VIQAHPVADIFPMMSEREFSDLVADIREHGVREPVWLHRDGRIIDGRNRYKACVQLGDEPPTRTFEGDDADLVAFVVSLNLHRRHLDESQRAMVAGRIATMPRGARTDLGSIDTTSLDQAAEMLNVGRASVARAKKVLESPAPELAAAVTTGSVAVSTAATLAEAPAEVQRDLVAALATDNEQARREAEKAIIRKATEIKQQRREVRQAAKAEAVSAIEQVEETRPVLFDVERGQWWQLGQHRLYVGDSTDEDFIEATRGAAFAFADPPYNAGKAAWDEGFVWGHDYLAKTADVVAVTPGISAIADFFSRSSMPYRWSMAAWITNGMTRGAVGFGNWIYVALFAESASLYRNAQDHLRLTVNTSTTAETAHASRKPAALMVELLELFTARGDLVVDPFLGSGTTMFAAEQTGRRCVGAELEIDHCAEIISRFGQATLL